MCVPDLVTLSSVYLHCYRLFAEYTALEWKAMAFRFSVYFNDFTLSLSPSHSRPRFPKCYYIFKLKPLGKARRIDIKEGPILMCRNETRNELHSTVSSAINLPRNPLRKQVKKDSIWQGIKMACPQ